MTEAQTALYAIKGVIAEMHLKEPEKAAEFQKAFDAIKAAIPSGEIGQMALIVVAFDEMKALGFFEGK